jgi:hypothetical protein
MQYGLRLLCLVLMFSLYGSTRRIAVDPVILHAIAIKAERISAPVITTTAELRYVDGWALSSREKGFGGLSSLLLTGDQFLAVSDSGAVIRFRFDATGTPRDASIGPLPKGCARDDNKRERDSESIAQDPVTGKIWIGFEWRNAICRADADSWKGERLSQPVAMQRWSKNGGPEAMLRLADGRFAIFAEFDSESKGPPPLLIADRDPTAPDVRFQHLRYAPPEHYFSPTDAVELRDGRLLVINRRFEPPINFSARLSLLDRIAPDQQGIVGGRTIASFGRPGLTSNFEGVAVSYEGDRIFVWIVSDDNYMWIEKTYLLKFELLSPEAGEVSAAAETRAGLPSGSQSER